MGNGHGIAAYNATTGAVMWQQSTGTQIYSSPAVAGPSGNKLIFAGDTAGNILALDLATGKELYSYPTGKPIFGSAAIANNVVYITSDAGYVYAFTE